MISLQHACFSSVLACAAATTLPPSPIEPASRCDSPAAHPDVDSPESEIVHTTSTEDRDLKNDEHDCIGQISSPNPSTDAVRDPTPPPFDNEQSQEGLGPEQTRTCDSPVHPANSSLPEAPVVTSIPAENETEGTDESNCVNPIPPPSPTPDVVQDPAPSPGASQAPKEESVVEQSQQDEVREHIQMHDVPRASFLQFARQFQLENHQRERKTRLLHRIRDLRISLGLSIRLLRVGSTVKKGLVENFKQTDKPSFVSTYNAICEMREVCDAASRRSIQGHDPLITNTPDLQRDGCSSFAHRLTQRSRDDLLEILTLARTDSQFLFRCIAHMTPSQLSTLISPVHTLNTSDSGFGVQPRGRTQPLFSKRSTAHSLTFKEHVFAFERTDPLSALVFNLFADPLDSDTPDARLRLDVWSSTCAKLISYGSSGHYSFVAHLLSCWGGAREWKAKRKFETYLMDRLQEGAFLLEQHDMRHLGIDGHSLDPLQTDVAEKFFQSSISALFEVLDDPDGGLPEGALQFGNAILGNLNVSESRKRFSEYIFFNWFFCKFLHNALTYPESLGLLLDFHVSREARERLLGQIALRAQAQVSRHLHSMPHYSLSSPDIKSHVENMLARLDSSNTPLRQTSKTACQPTKNSPENTGGGKPLLLSTTDITTVLDVLFPKSTSTFGSPQSHHQHISSPSPTTSCFQLTEPTSRVFQPGFFQGRIDTLSSGSSNSKTVFTTEMSFQDITGSYTSSPSYSMSPLSPQPSITRNAERIRFEISEINEADDRPTMDHPANEDWAMVYVSPDRHALSYHSVDDTVSKSRESLYNGFSDGAPNDRSDPLRGAILKLVDELGAELEDSGSLLDQQGPLPVGGDDSPSLDERFAAIMEGCQRQYDFVDAHYWWNASRLFKSRYPSLSPVEAETRIMSPMLSALKRSTECHTSIIRHCEKSFVDLKRTGEHFQTMVNTMMTTLQKVRNKMWYITDVRNSLRYEDARNVALALKKMGVPQNTSSNDEPKPRYGQRTLGGSVLQKPEIQVMNVMKAPGNQGGPSKLSDEQVEVTRKWLERFGIDNFCKGEERIHRFCYEVKSSVNKLVGETISESPVLWSSELYQKERSLYESPGARPVTGLSMGGSVRPPSIASEDSLYHSPQVGIQRGFDHLFRPMNDVNSLGRKSSYQSLGSERWKSGRDFSGADTSSVGDSPGRTISTSTGDLSQSFWSPAHTQTQSMTSASSLHSRPPSTFGEAQTPKRIDRKAHRKTSFLDDLKRTITSLLLSDLGSPVWSCGSETDAWFSSYSNLECIKEQTRKRTKVQRLLADLNAGARREDASRIPRRLRRSRSVDLGTLGSQPGTGTPPAWITEATVQPESCEESDFAYDAAFRQLMDKFSRPANPFIKLKALHDMRSLVVASISASNARQCQRGTELGAPIWESERQQRNSVSEGSKQPKSPETSTVLPPSPISESISMATESSPNSSPSEDQVIRGLRDLIQKLQPKTLFRDLQFIAAFVPSETLNKTDSGTAFLHFGLAAFGLKDDICNSIVEIADNIVSQELNTRQRRPTIPSLSSLMGHGIRDAAQLWTIPAREGNPVAQRELAILYLTHPELVRCVTLPLTMPRDTFKTDMMYRRDGDSKSDPQSMCLALHWMKLAAAGGDKLAQNRLREREEFDSIA